jgi:hypothetical protein
MGLLPDIKGLYREDLMKLAERDVLEPNVDGVLLSHHEMMYIFLNIFQKTHS